MKFAFLPVVALLVLPLASARADSFDIANFTPPPGFTRTPGNGVLLLEGRKQALLRREFCQIFLIASRPPSKPSPVDEFAPEFLSLASKFGPLKTLPAPQTQRTPDGWTVLTSHVDLVAQGTQGVGIPPGTPVRAMLASYFGSGKVMSVFVVVSANSYVAELGAFFNSLRLKSGGSAMSAAPALAPGPAVSNPQVPAAAPGSLANYAFEIPQGWRQTESRNRIVLMSPTYQGGEQCQLTIDPMHAASKPLADEAVNFYRQAFRVEPLAQYAYAWPKLYRGISPQGWEYFMIRKSIGGSDGDMGTIVFLAQAGDQVATIVATSKNPLVSNCFGELVRDQWPAFYYSLQFKNVHPSPQFQAAIQKRLAGEWIMATGGVGLQYSFNADGRYDNAAAARHVTRVMPGAVEVTTNTYFGNGSYKFDGNQIVMTGDDGRRFVQYFRMHQESTDGGRTWTDGFCLLDPGATGEVCYRRVRSN